MGVEYNRQAIVGIGTEYGCTVGETVITGVVTQLTAASNRHESDDKVRGVPYQEDSALLCERGGEDVEANAVGVTED